MLRQRVHLIIAVGTLYLLVGSASGKPIVFHKRPVRRHVTAWPYRPIVIVRPVVRRGPGFVGPRGEWYREMPTKRQLWIAYGF